MFVTKYVKPSLFISGAISVAFIFLLQLVITFSPYPGVTPDELTYQRQSFFPIPGDDGYGNQLFSSVYAFTNGCGDAWYQCVKSLNLIWHIVFAGAVGGITWSLSRNMFASFIVFIFSLLGPFGMYTSYFMPDTMMAGAVAVSFYLLVTAFRSNRKALVYLASISFGLAMLIKPHPFFIWFGLALFVGFVILFRLRTLHRDDLRTLLYFLVGSIFTRSLLALLVDGMAGLNPLASYIGGSFSDFFEYRGVETSETIARVDATFEGLLSAVTNLSPAVFVATWTFLMFRIIFGLQIADLLKSPVNQFLFLSFVSLVVMSAAFGFLLEFRGAEDTAFRSITRYWEYSWALAFAGILGTSVHHIDSTEGQTRLESKKPFGLILSFIISASYLLFIPRGQTAVDSGLLYGGYIWFIGLMTLGLLAAMLLAKVGWRQTVSATVVFAIALSGVSSAKLSEYLNREKSGVVSGYELVEIMKRHPADLNSIAFVGETSSANTASFIARLPYTTNFDGRVYQQIEYSSLQGEPRWVFASKEIMITGNPISTKVLGDVILYEFGQPLSINAAEFDRYGIAHNGRLEPTYWGAWATEHEVTISIPDYFESQQLEIGLMMSDQIEDKRIAIDYGSDEIVGELESNQVITPVTLTGNSQGFWAGRDITIRYFGDVSKVRESSRKLSFGVESIKEKG